MAVKIQFTFQRSDFGRFFDALCQEKRIFTNFQILIKPNSLYSASPVYCTTSDRMRPLCKPIIPFRLPYMRCFCDFGCNPHTIFPDIQQFTVSDLRSGLFQKIFQPFHKFQMNKVIRIRKRQIGARLCSMPRFRAEDTPPFSFGITLIRVSLFAYSSQILREASVEPSSTKRISSSR